MQLYKPDASLPATRILFDTNAVAARIRPWMEETDDVQLSIDTIRYKPNTSCLITYRMTVAGRESYLHIKAFRKSDWPVRKQKLLRRPAGTGNGILIDDDFSFALFRFPNDSTLPAVRKFVADPGRFLSRVLPLGSLEHPKTEFDILAYKPNRRLTVRLTFGSGVSHVLKMHDAVTFPRVLRSTDILRRRLPAVAPERTGRSNRHRTLAYRWIPGSELDLSTPSLVVENPLEWILEFLDGLHGSVDDAHVGLEVRSPVAGVKSVADYLEQIHPTVAPMVRQICGDILNNQDQNYQPILVHGDFHERQVIVSKADLRICDFDNCGLGDPSSDMANFVGHLHYRVCLGDIARDRVAQIEDSSLRHIFKRGGRKAMIRYRWNCVSAMLRLATNPFRSGFNDWMETTDRFLSEIMRQIEWVKTDRNSVANSGQGTRTGSRGVTRVGNDEIATQCPADSVRTLRSDPAFEFLAEACDAPSAERVLRQHIPSVKKIFGNYKVAGVTVLRHKPGRRCLLEFELSTENGTRAILGKASSKRLDRRAYEAQSRLFEGAGFGYENDDHISVPRPLGLWAPWKMWFQEKVKATEGIRFLNDDCLNCVTRQIAGAMAKLHSSDYVPAIRHSISDELRILNDRLKQVTTALPMFARRIERIRRSCVAIGDAIFPAIAAPVHRDFYHDQVLFGERQTYLVDLDLIALGHPALDVGNFLAHLTEYGVRHFGDPDYWIQEENDIVDYYLFQVPQADLAAITAFHAISFARHISISWTIPDRRKHLSTIIDVAEKLTTQGLRPSAPARLTP